MAGVRRAAKLLMKGGGDLEAGIIDLKSLQDVISGKLIPMINSVSTTLLKWSYTESNYTFPNVFSAWADLDAAFTQLLQEYIQECSKYRQCFKTIVSEAKRVSEVQKEKERTGSKVTATASKLENARKAAKKNESNEKTKTLVINLEADLITAIKKDAETEELLKTTLADFEFYKAFTLKDTLIAHCQALKILLQKGLELCHVKLEVAESMPASPVMTPEGLADNDAKVEDVFSRFSLQLPPRDPTIERNLPAQRFKSLPQPQSVLTSKSPKVTQRSVLVKSSPLRNIQGLSHDQNSDDDSDDYTEPDEQAIAHSPSEQKPPQLPPRNASTIDEEDYVVPILRQMSETKTDSQHVSTPLTDSDYFQVDSGDEEPRNPSAESAISQDYPQPSRQDQGIMEPLYSIPPDAEEAEEKEDVNDFNDRIQHIGYENLLKNQQHSVTPDRPRPRPYAKPFKPTVCPKPPHKTPKEIPLRGTKDSVRQIGSKVPSDDEVHSAFHEDENDNKTTLSPTAVLAHHTFIDKQRPCYDTTATSPNVKTKPGHIQHSYGSLSEAVLSRTTPLSTSDSDYSGVVHTYFVAETENARDRETYYSNVSETPTVAKKPPVPARKPPVPDRGNFKH